MKAEDIRVGNYISICDEIATVNCVSKDGISAISEKSVYIFEPFDKCFPIILTEEWLLKFGFEYDSYGNFTIPMPDNSKGFYKSNAPWIRVSFEDYACLNLSEHINVCDYDISAPCKYLHQLQNLYYALTGNELAFTEQ